MTVCVTGTMAAGKNLVSSLLEESGFKSIDADSVVHTVLETPEVKAAVLREFGALATERGISLQKNDGSLDRRVLAQLIFADKNLILRQEAIVYPAVTKHIEDFLEKNKNYNTVINATLLYKIPRLMQFVTKIFYIDAPFLLRFFRARKRDGLSAKQIVQRFAAQRNLFAKYAASNADIVKVWNVGSKAQLKRKIENSISAPAF